MKAMSRLWEKDAIQFPRLIAEMEAIGVFTPAVYNQLCQEMDLQPEELFELIDRARTAFDKTKESLK